MTRNLIETDRLFLRHLVTSDVEFIVELLNEPAFIRNIGDKHVRTTEGAANYLLNGPIASYEKNGFGLYFVGTRETGTPIGICGLLKRDALDDPDIGFAFLERFWGKGFAFEAASAVMKYARETVHLQRVVAITVQDNLGSINLLKKIGLQFEKMISMPGDKQEICLFASDLI